MPNYAFGGMQSLGSPSFKMPGSQPKSNAGRIGVQRSAAIGQPTGPLQQRSSETRAIFDQYRGGNGLPPSAYRPPAIKSPASPAQAAGPRVGVYGRPDPPTQQAAPVFPVPNGNPYAGTIHDMNRTGYARDYARAVGPGGRHDPVADRQRAINHMDYMGRVRPDNSSVALQRPQESRPGIFVAGTNQAPSAAPGNSYAVANAGQLLASGSIDQATHDQIVRSETIRMFGPGAARGR